MSTIIWGKCPDCRATVECAKAEYGLFPGVVVRTKPHGNCSGGQLVPLEIRETPLGLTLHQLGLAENDL